MDLSIEVKVPNTPLFQGRGSQIVGEEMVAATEFGLNALSAAVVPGTPTNLGLLRAAWGTKVEMVGTRTEILGRVFNPLGYALPVETGSRPHWPPIDALIQWARRKFSASEKEARSIGFLVARKISRQGTKPVLMAKRGLEQARGQVTARFDQALARIVERLGGR